MKIININYKFIHDEYKSPWMRAKSFSDKINAYFLDIRCTECKVDEYLTKAFSILFNQNNKKVVIFLEDYDHCDKDVHNFIERYLNSFDFPNAFFTINGCNFPQ